MLHFTILGILEVNFNFARGLVIVGIFAAVSTVVVVFNMAINHVTILLGSNCVSVPGTRAILLLLHSGSNCRIELDNLDLEVIPTRGSVFALLVSGLDHELNWVAYGDVLKKSWSVSKRAASSGVQEEGERNPSC